MHLSHNGLTLDLLQALEHRPVAPFLFKAHTAPVKRFRAILVLLLSLTLPYSAVAGMLDNVRCHHDGLGALVDASAHHDHAAMAGQHHDQASDQAGDHGCDCAVK